MMERVALLKEIEKLPSKYFGEVVDFVEYLRQKAYLAGTTQKEYENDIEGYKAMAADAEREKEAQEWCNASFGPVSS